MSQKEEVKQSLMEILEKVIDGYLEESNDEVEPTELIVILQDSSAETFSISVVPGPPDSDTLLVLKSVVSAISEELGSEADDDETMEYLH